MQRINTSALPCVCSPVTTMGTRQMRSSSIHLLPTLTLLGSSHKFMRVPTTIWLLTVHCAAVVRR